MSRGRQPSASASPRGPRRRSTPADHRVAHPPATRPPPWQTVAVYRRRRRLGTAIHSRGGHFTDLPEALSAAFASGDGRSRDPSAPRPAPAQRVRRLLGPARAPVRPVSGPPPPTAAPPAKSCPPGLPPLVTGADYAGPVRAAVVTYK